MFVLYPRSPQLEAVGEEEVLGSVCPGTSAEGPVVPGNSVF